MKPLKEFQYRLLDRSLLNPASWAGCALVLMAAWALMHLLGWRVDTAVISGTVDISRGTAQWAMMRGALYALAYFGTTIISPILLLATGIYLLLFRVAAKANET